MKFYLNPFTTRRRRDTTVDNIIDFLLLFIGNELCGQKCNRDPSCKKIFNPAFNICVE